MGWEGAEKARSLVTLWGLYLCLEYEIHHIPSLMAWRTCENSGDVCLLAYLVDVNTESQMSKCKDWCSEGQVQLRLCAVPATMLLCSVLQSRHRPVQGAVQQAWNIGWWDLSVEAGDCMASLISDFCPRFSNLQRSHNGKQFSYDTRISSSLEFSIGTWSNTDWKPQCASELQIL